MVGGHLQTFVKLGFRLGITSHMWVKFFVVLVKVVNVNYFYLFACTWFHVVLGRFLGS